VIDQAVGIIISRSGGTPEAAMNRIRTLSRNNHIKVSAVATNIVDEAAQRARSRAAQRKNPT